MIKSLLPLYFQEFDTNTKKEIEKDFRSGDKMLMNLMWVHWLLSSTLIAYKYGLYGFGIVGGGIVTGLAFLAYKFHKGQTACRVVMGSCLALYTGIYITQQMGLIEAHFHYFIGITILLRYRDALPLLAHTLTILVHHLAATYCQSQGVSFSGVELVVFDWGTVEPLIYHLFAAVLASGLGFYIIHGNTTQFLGILRNTEAVRTATESKEEFAAFLNITASRYKDIVSGSGNHHSISINGISEIVDTVVSASETSRENALKVQTLAGNSADQARATGEQIVAMQQSMLGIREVSNRISEINKNIDGIAFQTNILALNAAVEAARAGDSGQGFAVVADEVRNLATRSAEAARQAEEHVSSSLAQVSAGNEIANKTLSSSKQMVELVEELSDFAGKMVGASDSTLECSRTIKSHVTNLSDEANRLQNELSERMNDEGRTESGNAQQASSHFMEGGRLSSSPQAVQTWN